MTDDLESANAYDVVACVPSTLAPTEMAQCFALLENGEAVDVDTAKRDLPNSSLIVVVRHAGNIVGLGANKGSRPWYAAKVAELSGYDLPIETPELGYVVVDDNHRNNHLSTTVVAALVKHDRGPLFATTDSVKMKAVLGKAGFEKKGGEWPGERAQLSLWLRASSADTTSRE